MSVIEPIAVVALQGVYAATLAYGFVQWWCGRDERGEVLVTRTSLSEIAIAIPATAVAGAAVRGPAGVVYRDRGMTRVRVLAGRRVAFETTPRGRALLRRLIAHDGGDPDAVIEIDNHGRETIPDMIAAGYADASFGSYWCWDTLLGNFPESERVTWRVDTIGAPAYHSYLLGTQRSLALTSTSWTHAGRWGELRRALLEPYTAWLAGAIGSYATSG